MLARIFLSFNALAIGSIGVFYLIDPNMLLARYDLAAGSVGMDNMLRSTYGGIFLVAAALFAVGVFVSNRRRDALAFVSIFMIGAALGRVVSIIAVGAPPASIMPLLYFEIIMAIIAMVLYVRAPRAA